MIVLVKTELAQAQCLVQCSINYEKNHMLSVFHECYAELCAR